MARVQLVLTDEQEQRLEELARERKTSKANLVREGVEWVLQQKRTSPDDPLLELVGQAGQIGRRDVSTNHDAYLTAIERKRNR